MCSLLLLYKTISSFKFFCQIRCCVSYSFGCDLFGSAGCHNHASLATAFGSHIYYMVCHFYYVEVVFDDDNGVSFIYKAVNDIHQHADIFKMQACSWFIKQIECLAGIAL